MTTIATRATDAPAAATRPGRAVGLSGRLILLTLLFMTVAEILVYVPAVTSFRRAWISDRVMGAQMVALTLSATPSGSITGALETRLLAGVKGAQAIGVRGQGTRWLLPDGGTEPPSVVREIDLRRPSWFLAMRGTARNLLLPPSPATRIIAPGARGVSGQDWVELIVDERPLRAAMLAFSRDFLLVSLIIAGITAALLYLALHVIVVRPVRRLSANIAAFAEDPENAGKVLATNGRTDEIGVVEHTLARMETALSGELRQKRHLAELGLAVSKINHELRNMLTTAQLLGDRLAATEDPAAKRITPRLIATLARAIEYCGATLAYGRAGERPPQRVRVPLTPIVLDQLDLTAQADGHPITTDVRIPDNLVVDADPDQLGRVLLNLMRNSVEALTQARTPEACIAVSAVRTNGSVAITVVDNGPGVPDRIRTRLFSAFQASGRSGGTGLGLPVAEELVRLHGGTLVLEESATGARFRITVPDRPAA